MAFNLLDAVKGFFTNDLIEKAAAYNGETGSAIANALKVAVPVSLAGIVQKAESSPESVLNLARQAFNSGILGNLSDSFSQSGAGIPSGAPGLISSIFGDKFGSIANALSGFAGIKGATSSSLFGSIIPLALGLLGKHANESDLTPGALSSLLSDQKNSVLHSIPSGFNLSNFFAFKSVETDHAHVVEKSANKMLLPILLAILAIVFLWFIMKGCNMDGATPVAEASHDTHDTTATHKPEASTISNEPIKVKLPNGVELNAHKDGIEDLLVSFILSDTSNSGKDNWFDFNDLNFKFGTAEIVPESRHEIDNIVEILKAFPKVKIKIGGYTDRVGDEGVNKKLSQDRANAIAAALKEAGVSSQVTGAEGYGSEFATYPAEATEEDRIKDRRVSVSVREK